MNLNLYLYNFHPLKQVSVPAMRIPRACVAYSLSLWFRRFFVSLYFDDQIPTMCPCRRDPEVRYINWRGGHTNRLTANRKMGGENKVFGSRWRVFSQSFDFDFAHQKEATKHETQTFKNNRNQARYAPDLSYCG